MTFGDKDITMVPDSTGREDDGLSDDDMNLMLDNDIDDDPPAAAAEVADNSPGSAEVDPSQADDAGTATDPAADASPDPGSESDPTPSPADEPAPTAEDLLNTYHPPEGGLPYSLRVDGTDVPLTGALSYPTGVWLPRDTVERELVPKWVANRETWRVKEQGYQRSLKELEGQRSHKELVAQHTIDKFDALIQGDEQALLDFIADVREKGPLLQKEAENAALTQRLEELERQEAEEREQADHATFEPQMQHYLGSQFEAILAQEPYKLLLEDRPQAVRLLRSVWDRHKEQLFQEDPNGPVLLRDARGGTVRASFRHDLLQAIVDDHAAIARSFRAKQTAIKKVQEQNAAATKATPAAKGTKTVIPPKPRKAGTKKVKTPDEWDEEFEDLDLLAD